MGLLSGYKPKSAEELAAQQAEFDAQAKAMSDRRTVTLVGASGLGSSMSRIGGAGTNLGGKRGRDGYDDIARGSTYAVNKDDRGEFIDIGGSKAYWSPEHGEWRGTGHDSAGGNHAASRFYTSNNAVAAQSGGGGGKRKKNPKPKDPVTGRDIVTDPGVTTGDVLGQQGYNSMMNFQPISNTMGGDGQTQHLNPLVDAGNWLHQLQPQQVTSPGTYIGPGVGLLQKKYAQGLLGGA